MLKNLLVLPDGQRISSGVGTTLAIQKLTLTQCVNPTMELEPGGTCASALEVTLFTPGGSLSLPAGEELTLYQVDDRQNQTKAGVFVVETVTRPSANTLHLVCYDRTVKLDQDLTQWLQALPDWPYALQDLAKLVCDACDLELATETIPNGTFPVQKFRYSEVTGRQLMRWIGQIACCFSRVDPDGRLHLDWYQNLDKTVCASGALRYYAKGLRYETYLVAAVDRVQIRIGEDVWPAGEEGENCYVLAANPLIMADVSPQLEGYLEVIRQRLNQAQYTPCKVTMPAGSQIPVGSLYQVQDANGNRVTTCVMTKTTTGQREVLESTGSPKRSSATATNNKPQADKLNRLQLSVKSLDGKKVASMINLSEDGVKIRADKISLEGVVTANKHFKVMTDGSIEAKAGKIAGWNMDNNSLYSGNSFQNADCFLCTGSVGSMAIGGSEDRTGWVLKAGDRFGVTKEGDLYANNVRLTGHINATTGRIGMWDIEDGYLQGMYVFDTDVERIVISPGGVTGFYTNAEGRKVMADVPWRAILTAAMRWNEK